MIGIVLENKYKIVEEIGSGGTALVYKALNLEDRRYYAAKIMRPELAGDEELLYRFQRESRALAELSHPNIVTVYSVGCEEVTDNAGKREMLHYFIMELIDGMTLKKYIAAHGALDPAQAGRIAVQVCSALSHAHSKHIIHRDIKSQNIILNRNMDVKVADFGIARLTSQTTVAGRTNSIMGSVHYMSPEQTRNGYVSESTDLYSLGVVLYEMLTGKLPFDGDDPVTVALKHVNEKLPPMSAAYPTLPRAYCYIVDKALQKRTRDRYASAKEMENDLSVALLDPNHDLSDHETPVAAPPAAEEKQNSYTRQPKNSERHQNTDRINARKKRKKQMRILQICLISAGVLIVLGVILFATLSPRESLTVLVPNVKNMDSDAAAELLHSLNIRYNVDSYVNDNSVSAGKVVAQSPSANTEVKKASDIVHLIVSLGPAELKMTDAVGKNVETAIRELADLGVDTALIEIIYEESDFETGTVVTQRPLQNEKIYSNGKAANGDSIRLVLARKKSGGSTELIEVPNLVGMTQEEAAAALDERGLTYIFSDSNSTYEYGKVFSQHPGAKSKVAPNYEIKVFVSRGPLGTIEVPSFISKTEDEAVAFIREHEFTEKVNYVYDSAEPIGTVIRQLPLEKTYINPYDNPVIEIWVSALAPTPTPSPTLTPTPTPTPTPEPTEAPTATPDDLAGGE
ncbi:MAG: Stk1 family PASTA domain-containing Ser/Thr kinase [Eubacteriales bacterium]|nr:Stk1 family PASTA domain-containing Ser/Thr kinase [Eubacteriales bacterium]